MNLLTPYQAKALNIERSISLTANAGSGKTFVLAQRFLQILLTTNTPLNKIAAITFTEKAAGELFKKISIELEKLLQVTTDADSVARIQKIRKQLVSAKISTIHSFCIDLLKEFPVEASLDANFLTIDQKKASELIDISIQNTLRDMLNDPKNQSNVKLLIRLLGSANKLASEILDLISKRTNMLVLIEKYYSSSEQELSSQLFELFLTNIEVLFTKKFEETYRNIKNINDSVLQLNPKNESANQIKHGLKIIKPQNELIENLILLKLLTENLLTSKGQIRKQGYLPSKARNGLEISIITVEKFYSQLNKIELTEDHEKIERELTRYIFALINIFNNVLSAYDNKKSELGVLDFEDILISAKKLLDNDSVKESLAGKFNYLLVDEYQDTNEIQYEIFLPLLDNLRKGNLFIVGDEKQSIYRFRDADLQVFSRTKSDIQKIYGDESLLTLPDSFRMAPSICVFVNYLFQNLFKKPNLLFNEVPATDLVCARSDDFEGKIEILIASTDENSEAELVAKRIVKLKREFSDRLKEWNDIAILVRKRSSFIELQKVFIRNKIPFNLVGGTGFYQKQSISDIYNYFAFLLNNKDDASLVGVLRSPFFLISDVKIFELSSIEGGTYWHKLKNATNLQKSFWGRIYATLDENKELSKRINIPVLLRKILRESDFISVISSRSDSPQEISNINKLISLTNDFFNEEFRTLYDYVSFLKESIERTEDESQGRIEPGSIGVNLLTIHQSKGLEFSAVFLYKCNEISQTNKVKSKSFTVDKDFGILTKVPLDENYFGEYLSAPLVGIYNLFEEKKELAELKRLLYVGLTRAIDFLFISLSEENRMEKKNSFTALLKEGLGVDFSDENFKITGELTFLQKEKNEYKNSVSKIETEIPIVRDLNSIESEIIDQSIDIDQHKFYLSDIIDESKGEVISATRFSTFSRCPMMYNLLYNYKIGELIQRSGHFLPNVMTNIREEYSRSELETYLLDDQISSTDISRFKGDLIHYALRKNIKNENLTAFIEDRFIKHFMKGIPESLLQEVRSDILKFYSSAEFKFINSYPDHKNEYEVYLKEKDYYLFGILDTLIIAEKKLIIVDYKTDDIKEKDIKTRAANYIPQINFYAYIVSRLFTQIQEIEGRIIFIKHPDKSIIFKYDDSADFVISSGISTMISSIRKNYYLLNLDTCKDCIFADQNMNCKSYFTKSN